MYFNPEIFNLCSALRRLVQRHDSSAKDSRAGQRLRREVAHRVRYEREAPRRRMTARFRDAIAHGNTTSRA